MGFLPDYANMTPKLLALYIVAGVFGALVRVAYLDKPLRWFYRDPDGKGWKLGFFGEVITGVAVAIFVDGHPVRAAMGAVMAPYILDALRGAVTQILPLVIARSAGFDPLTLKSLPQKEARPEGEGGGPREEDSVSSTQFYAPTGSEPTTDD